MSRFVQAASKWLRPTAVRPLNELFTSKAGIGRILCFLFVLLLTLKQNENKLKT